MNAFSPDNIIKAIARLPSQSSNDITNTLKQAQKHGIVSLAQACEAELEARPFDFSKEKAIAFEKMSDLVIDLDLTAAIRIAFTVVEPPNIDEIKIIRWIAANPGGTFQDAQHAHGKGDLGLIIGHLAYERFGCFRRFMDSEKDQSSVLIQKVKTKGSVKYTLKPETHAVFSELGII